MMSAGLTNAGATEDFEDANGGFFGVRSFGFTFSVLYRV